MQMRRSNILLLALGLAAVLLAPGCSCSKKKSPEGKWMDKASPASPSAPAASPSAKSTPVTSLQGADAAKVAMLSQITGPADPGLFPLRTEAGYAKLPSPDGQRLMWRAKRPSGYFLVTANRDGSAEKAVEACKNAWLPQWSPDGTKAVFTSMDWKKHQRSVCVYDFKAGKLISAFKSKRGLGGLASFTPDGGKVVFTYRGSAWVMNASGIGLSMLKLDHPASRRTLAKVSG